MKPHDDAAPTRLITFNDHLRYQTRDLTAWVGRQGARIGLSADAVTVAGLVVILISAYAAAQGQFFISALLILVGGLLDGVDGAIARAIQTKNRFGALLDSTLDRYADGFLFFGIAYYYVTHDQPLIMALAVTALIGAYMVSYVRARAEGLGIGSIKDGWFDRTVRTAVLFFALLIGQVIPGLVILAIGNHITALQRLWLVYRATRSDGCSS